MTTIQPRRLGAALATCAALAAGTVAGTAAGPADGAAPAARAAHRTALTFEMPGCDGCKVQLYRGRETKDPHHPSIWISREKKVDDGEVSWTVRSKRTQGMSMTVVAPWEGQTGYLTTVAFRYGREDVGDEVTFKEARSKRWASACWEGTRRDEVTIPVVVRQVMVRGVHERVKGSIAYLPETSSWLPPMRRAYRGVLGSQDINLCG